VSDINHIFIDEAGDLDSQSKIFLMGCIITDTPDDLLNEISLLKDSILNSGYFNRFRAKFQETGFHASTNHPDIYSRFVALLPRLNFRYFALILNKMSRYYDKMVTTKSKNAIYDDALKSLLKDRLIKRTDDTNMLFFEQNLANPSLVRINARKKQLESVISELGNSLVLKTDKEKGLQYKISVQDKKSQPLFCIVDYMNHIVMKVYEGKQGKVENYMKENYRLIEPKIGCIHDVANKTFHKPRKKGIDVDSSFIK
jgi:hypothetical protein